MKGNSILSKLKYYVNKEVLRVIYFAKFHSSSPLYEGKTNHKYITVLEKKALKTMIFAPCNAQFLSCFHDIFMIQLFLFSLSSLFYYHLFLLFYLLLNYFFIY